MGDKELPCPHCGQDLHIPARYNADNIAQLEAEIAALKMEKEYLRGKAQAVVDGKTGGGFDKFSGFDDYIIPYQLVDELADALLGDQDA